MRVDRNAEERARDQKKLKAGSCVSLSPRVGTRPVPFQQRTNTSCQLSLPTHGFTVVLSVFRGTPPTKPLNCKIRFLIRRDAISRSWAHLIGGQLQLAFAKFNLSPSDITWMSFQFYSQCFGTFVYCQSIFMVCRETKNPAYFRKQGWRKSFRPLEPAYT